MSDPHNPNLDPAVRALVEALERISKPHKDEGTLRGHIYLRDCDACHRQEIAASALTAWRAQPPQSQAKQNFGAYLSAWPARMAEMGRAGRALTRGGEDLAAACEPWKHCVGDPPDWGSPLHSVFVAGMLYSEKLLCGVVGVERYEPGDGSEDFDIDASNSLLNILKAAKLYDDEDGSWAALARPVADGLRDQVWDALQVAKDTLDPAVGALEGTAYAVKEIDAAMAAIAASTGQHSEGDGA